MRYELKENSININSQNPIIDYLKSLGIKKPDHFLSEPPQSDELDPFLLSNMKTCLLELKKGFDNNKKFFLQVDSDVDGYTSATIFYRYFKLIYPDSDIQWRIHEAKEHGVIVDTVAADIDYVILPDSGSMQISEQKQLNELGKTIIILDHHNIQELQIDPKAIIVNNQISPLFDNKDLSGAGVVFKTIQGFDRMFGYSYSKQFYDLAALGILSDMMDTRNLDNNYIIYKGIHNIKSKIFKAILEKQAYSINKEIPTKIDIVFYVTPLINGVIRAGEAEDKENLFKAFLEEPTQEYIETEYRGVIRQETFYEYQARNAYNIKNRQNNQKAKCFEFLKNKIKDNNLQNNKVITVLTSKDDKIPVPQTITGLIAMELLKEYNNPVLVLRPKVENGQLMYSGSGRGKQAENFNSFLHFMRDSQFVTYAEGHPFAFGASIPANKLQDFIKESNEKLKETDFNVENYFVDAIFNKTNINYQMLYEFGKYDYIYGNNIPKPLIVIEGSYNSGEINFMGEEQTTVKIMCGNLSCIKKKDKNLTELLQKHNNGRYVMIGRPEINYWGGRETLQLIIDNIEIEPIDIKKLF